MVNKSINTDAVTRAGYVHVNPQYQMTADFSLRTATESDVPLLLELWRDSMSPKFSALGILPSEENSLHRVLMRFECAEVILLKDNPVGLLKVDRDGKHWKLIQILLNPTVQRRGIGTRLITNLIAEAQSSGASLILSVLKQNSALALYLRLGFVVVGEEEHAFNMRWGG